MWNLLGIHCSFDYNHYSFYFFPANKNTLQFSLLVFQEAKKNHPKVLLCSPDSVKSHFYRHRILFTTTFANNYHFAKISFYLGVISGKALRLYFQRAKFQAFKILLASSNLSWTRLWVSAEPEREMTSSYSFSCPQSCKITGDFFFSCSIMRISWNMWRIMS